MCATASRVLGRWSRKPQNWFVEHDEHGLNWLKIESRQGKSAYNALQYRIKKKIYLRSQPSEVYPRNENQIMGEKN